MIIIFKGNITLKNLSLLLNIHCSLRLYTLADFYVPKYFIQFMISFIFYNIKFLHTPLLIICYLTIEEEEIIRFKINFYYIIILSNHLL